MSIYQFNPEDARRFAMEQGIHVKVRGKELVFAECPYCRSKDKGTFAINLRTGQFKCMRASCGAHGNMITLHADFGFDLGSDVAEFERPRYEWRRFKRPEEGFQATDAALDYLHGKRGIAEDVIRRYDITTHKDDPNRLVFPFVDEEGNVAFIKYRAINFDKTKGGNKEWCEHDMRAILFGMNHCEDGFPLVITEGQIDSLTLSSCGIKNAVSVPTGKNGMTWIPHCWNWLERFKEIIVFGDFEHGEMTLLEPIKSRFGSSKSIRAVRAESYHGCKDANELYLRYGKAAILSAVDHAEHQMLKQVDRLSDVQYEEGKKREMIPTGIPEIDKVLHGGLALGYLHILTGKRGEGKSTFGSMITKNALERGKSVFIYSGEMRKGFVRKWLDFQIAGAERIEHRLNEFGYTEYELSKPISEQIGAWYRDRAYIYNASTPTEEKTDLITIVETYINQFGCQYILIDNLMTAIDICAIGRGLPKFERQEAICKELARIALQYNVLILLIAHKKKTDPKYDSDENDDVLGSSEVTNLSGVIMSYGRSTKVGADQRQVRVTKNRDWGEYTTAVANYDKISKRIYGENGDPNIVSSAFLVSDEDLVKQFTPVEDDDIPF